MATITAEKPGRDQHDNDNGVEHGVNGEVDVPTCPPHTTERRLLAKIDMRVLPFLCVMYLLAFLDRINISNANVYGMSQDLNLGHGNKFNTALVIFFVPYCAFDIPSNILLKKFKPHVWLSVNMFLFGFTNMMQGFVKNYSGLLATRFFLGIFEMGMFPGAFYLIGMWYRREEAQKRYSFFFSSTTLAGAFAGLLAAAIGKMNGLRGYAGWRWIFILEGSLTIFVSFFFFFLLPDFPEESKWLTEDEKAYVTARISADQGSSNSARNRSISWRDVVKVVTDPKVILGGFMYFGLIVPAYSYAYFSASIIKTYGYTPIMTQLYSVPPWAAAFAFSMLVAFVSDMTKHRFAFSAGAVLLSIIGLSILISVHDNRHLEYGALFLVTLGTYTAMPIVVCWFNMNLGGHHRRAIGNAWQMGFGNIGGIIASFSFQANSKDPHPKFISGFSICLSFCVVSLLAQCTYGYLCLASNRSRAKNGPNHALTKEERTELGDLSPKYRYML